SPAGGADAAQFAVSAGRAWNQAMPRMVRYYAQNRLHFITTSTYHAPDQPHYSWFETSFQMNAQRLASPRFVISSFSRDRNHHSLASHSSPHSLADGEPVAQRDDRREEFRRAVNQAVELLSSAGLGVLGGRLSRHAAGPQDIVSDEQPAHANSRDSSAKHVRVLSLIHVVEDQIKLPLRGIEQMKRVSYQDPHATENTGAPQIPFRAPGIGRITVRVEHPPLGSHSPRQPQRGVADGRAHFKHAPGAD